MKNEKWGLLLGVGISILFAWFTFVFLNYKETHQALRQSSALLETTEILDQRITDIKYRLRPPYKSEAKVALVAIDEAAVNEIGRWPWDRDVIAELTKRLLDLGARSVAFDVVFSEPDKANPAGDDAFAKLIKERPEQIILGTFSESQFNYKPYQDICVTEAFLAVGGDQLVKPSPLFVIDEPSTIYDDLNWTPLFSVLFSNIEQQKEQQVLESLNKTDIGQLTPNQTRYLKSQKSAALFEYCKTWLTQEDIFLSDDVKENVRGFYDQVFQGSKELSTQKLEQIIPTLIASYKNHPVPQYGEWKKNIEKLQEPSAYTASFIAQLDSDGYVRHYPLYFRSGNRLGTSFIPSLALQSWLLAGPRRVEVKGATIKDARTIETITEYDTSKEPETIAAQIPVDKSGDLIINYYGRQLALPHVSAAELFNDKPTIQVARTHQKAGTAEVHVKIEEFDKKEFFKDRSLIFGATAVGLYDLRNTPLEANYPGPEIHLTVLANLLDHNFLKHWEQETTWMPLVVLVLGILITFANVYLGSLASMGTFLSCFGLIMTLDWWLFRHHNILLRSLLAYVTISITFIAVQAYRYFTEERKKKELKSTFSKYVSPAVVDELLKDVENLKLGGRREHMTAFFSDVRGFTTISEKLTPEELSRVLNLYLTPMTEIVFKNKGTLDKYMGDAIMAFFGAPVKDTDHAKNACRCALDSIEKLKEIQKEFEQKNLPIIDIGIGINTGPMSVGNMGSNIVQNYTIMGDAVNLASRLEGINKEYGTRIVISEFTYKEIKDSFTAREIDKVKVKGKTEPVSIFELICEGQPPAETKNQLDLFNAAYEKYHKKQFAQALAEFSAPTLKNDPVAEVFVERCQEYLESPPEENWDGAYVMKTK